ncbi:MAG: serine--tRNA ligase [Ignavibacteria bacterium]|nr:serine--tRNA ligase [Ignavibacteria bacterium]
MLDIKQIRDNPGFVKEKLILRNEYESAANIDRIMKADKDRLELIKKGETLKQLRNKVSEEIAILKKNKENTDDKIAEMKKVSDEIKNIDENLRNIEKEIGIILFYIPNLPADNVPVGKTPEDNIIIKSVGKKSEFNFKPSDHIELSKRHNIIDFERGAKISGSGFPLYKGKGAMLERALINYMLDEHIRKGYKEVLTPVIVNRASMEAAEKVPKFEDDMYRIDPDDLFAIPTAEVSIINIHRDETFNEEELPVKYCGYTNCFRREAGSYGKDTRGLLRIHQFNKVELITFCRSEESYKIMEEMLDDACSILDGLEIHYRVIELCTGDLGFAASKCYDIECWAPAEEKWLEVSSISNCTDFQARRGRIKYKKPVTHHSSRVTNYVHILNGSGLATPRLMVALLESNQTESGSIIIPPVLRKYTGFNVIE